MITVVINGQNYNYPEVGDTDWGSIATLAFDAITKTTLQPVKDLNDPSVVNDFTLYNDIDFGPTHGLRVVFIQSRSNNPAATGVFRLAKDELVAWRNEDNDGDNTISFDSDGDLIVNGVKVTLHGQIVNDDVAAAAGIEESKLALDYSTDSLHTAIEDKAISNLKDTNINTPYNKQALMYDGGTSKWINRLIVLDDVSDTIVSNPYPGDILLYDGVRWSNEQNSVDALTDAQVLNPADGDVLAYNSNISSWENSKKVTNHVADKNNPHETSLSNLKDTTISSPSNGDALTFDGSKWINSPSTSSSLSGLSDTDITTPANGDTLVYNSVSTKWENSSNLSSHVGNTSNPHDTKVSNLDDTTLSGLNYGDRLTYDSGTSTWFNQPNTLGALIDTGISQETNGDALVYDGVQWINRENSVDNLTDTNISNKADGDVIVYDANSGYWNNTNALTTVNSNLSSHTGNTSNPHSTSVDNLTDSDIDSNTLTENDVLVFNDQTQKWENSQILVNHIGNAANPHLTTVSNLTDTNITTPQNGDILTYDANNYQWVNAQGGGGGGGNRFANVAGAYLTEAKKYLGVSSKPCIMKSGSTGSKITFHKDDIIISPLGVETTLAADVSLDITSFSASDEYFIFYSPANNELIYATRDNMVEKNSEPPFSTSTVWLNYNTNVIKAGKGATSWSDTAYTDVSLPLCIVKNRNIIELFDYFGSYFLKYVYIYPNTKYLSPQGRNADGTFKNEEVVINNGNIYKAGTNNYYKGSKYPAIGFNKGAYTNVASEIYKFVYVDDETPAGYNVGTYQNSMYGFYRLFSYTENQWYFMSSGTPMVLTGMDFIVYVTLEASVGNIVKLDKPPLLMQDNKIADNRRIKNDSVYYASTYPLDRQVSGNTVIYTANDNRMNVIETAAACTIVLPCVAIKKGDMYSFTFVNNPSGNVVIQGFTRETLATVPSTGGSTEYCFIAKCDLPAGATDWYGFKKAVTSL